VITVPGGADILDVQTRAHGLTCVAQARAADGGDWYDLYVKGGSVELGELGALPTRKLSMTVMSWSASSDDVTDYVDPFGSWIRLFHDVIRVDGTRIRVPLGYYRVETMKINPLDGTIELTASDVGALVVDYGLTTLAQGQVTTGTTYLSALTTMLTAALAGIPPWWTTALDPGTASSTAKPLTRLQYSGSRAAAAVNLAALLGRKIATPLDGSAAFRLVIARDASDESDITIRPGQGGNLVINGFDTTMDRTGIANVALITYTREVKTAGAKTRIEQRRLITEYVNPDGDTAAGGPFGRVTIDVESANLADDTAARAAADTALKGTLTQVRDVSLPVAPVYGLESGDIIRMEDSQGIATKGIAAAAQVGLTAADDWTVTVRSFIPVGKWSGPRRTVLTDAYTVRDDTDWHDYPSKTADLTGATIKGWSASGGTVKDGGSRMLYTAGGSGTARLYTSATWSVPYEHRIRVRFSVKADTRDIRARAYIDPNASGPVYGGFVTIKKGKTKTVTADLTITGAGSTFTVGIDMDRADGAALNSGSKIYVSNINVERAVRKAS
jgi:hypothetical protein